METMDDRWRAEGALTDENLRARIIGREWRVKRDDLDAYVRKFQLPIKPQPRLFEAVLRSTACARRPAPDGRWSTIGTSRDSSFRGALAQ